MGYYKVRRDGLLNAWQIKVAEYTFYGKSDEQIAKELFFSNGEPTSKEMARAKDRIRRLKKTKNFIDYYKSIITEWTVHNVGRALNKLSDQIDANEPWLANKAANDVLTRGMPLFASEDANTIKVEVSGMPTLGTPDSPDEGNES